MKCSTPRIGAFAALVTMVMWTSCIFDTRDAHPPKVVGGGCVLDESNKAFACMAAALTALRDADYLRSISETFVFSPTTADSLDQNFNGKCPYENWTKEVERENIGFLVSNSSALTWDYGTPTIQRQNTTFVRFVVDYSLLVASNAAPPDTTEYRGIAEIDVRNEGGNWRVTYWKETQTVPDFSTWGFLRGTIRDQLGDAGCGP
ncbi:MAG TPA: hypothetical protein VF128_14185 [Gemmatimonadaceae bacterium]